MAVQGNFSRDIKLHTFIIERTIMMLFYHCKALDKYQKMLRFLKFWNDFIGRLAGRIT